MSVRLTLRVVMPAKIGAWQSLTSAYPHASALGVHVDLTPCFLELLGHLGQAVGHRVLAGGGVADFLADLHRAELGTAHRAEVGDLVGLLRQSLVVEFARG